MYKAFKSILIIFWVLDILDLDFMQMFDTTYAINGLAWLLIWLYLPSTETITRHNINYEDE